MVKIIDNKIIEKCIWKIGLDAKAISEKYIQNNCFPCLINNCDGYDVNCKTHPQYKEFRKYKEVKK